MSKVGEAKIEGVPKSSGGWDLPGGGCLTHALLASLDAQSGDLARSYCSYLVDTLASQRQDHIRDPIALGWWQWLRLRAPDVL